MATFHLGRTTEDVRRELSDIFRTMKDPRVAGMLSIVKVDLSSDYSYCKVYVSSMDGLAAAKEAVKGLNNGAGYIRREINRRLRMRRSPEFHFVVMTPFSTAPRSPKPSTGWRRRRPAGRSPRTRGRNSRPAAGKHNEWQIRRAAPNRSGGRGQRARLCRELWVGGRTVSTADGGIGSVPGNHLCEQAGRFHVL